VLEFVPTSSHAQSYTFNISASDLAGETATIKVNLTVNIPTGIDNSSLGNIEIYPNPASDILQIRNLTDVGSTKIQIVNMHGSTISEQTLKDPNIDISNLNSGVYILKVSSKENSLIKRFIKK